MFKLEFETSNAAFRESGELDARAVAEVINDVTRKVLNGGPSTGSVFDAYGNTVGRWELSGD